MRVKSLNEILRARACTVIVRRVHGCLSAEFEVFVPYQRAFASNDPESYHEWRTELNARLSRQLGSQARIEIKDFVGENGKLHNHARVIVKPSRRTRTQPRR